MLDMANETILELKWENGGLRGQSLKEGTIEFDRDLTKEPLASVLEEIEMNTVSSQRVTAGSASKTGFSWEIIVISKASLALNLV